MRWFDVDGRTRVPRAAASLDIRSAAQQLAGGRQCLDGLIPEEFDADRPQCERLEYMTRSRSFSDAFTARDAKKKKKSRS